MLGKVEVKLRPIKIAFLVDPRNKRTVLEAIKISSFLWGGVYNPIIPVHKRVPAVWKRNNRFINLKSNATAITLGYIDTFDPDYFVVLGGCDTKHLNLDKNRIIPTNDILGNVESDGTPSYGVGLFEILSHFIHEELRFERRQPLNIYFPRLEREYQLFLASVVGKLPTNIEALLKKNYREDLGAEDRTVSIDTYAELLEPSTLFVRRFSSLHIKARPSHGGFRSSAIFFLDAHSVYDVIDYWNLRAMGWAVIPVPKQSAGSEATKQLARNFIEEQFGPSRHNPSLFFNTTIIKGRSVDEDAVEAFLRSLDIPRPTERGAHKVSLQHWYPRMWDEWARDKDGVDGCELEAGEANFELSDTDTRIKANTVDPPFISRFGGNGKARFANTVTFNIYGGNDLPAQVIPTGGSIELVRAIGGLEPDSWRFSRKELVYLAKHIKWSIYASVPAAKDVFSAWMKSLGWETTESSPGKIAYQMTRRLGGIHGLSILSHQGVLDLLKKLEGGKVIGKEEFFADIAKVGNKGRIVPDKAILTQRLLETEMIRLGVECQCPGCQQRSWFSIKELDYRVQCHNCFEQFEIPSATPDKIKWAYRAFGPFSLPGRAHGVYSVLLTLRFFSNPSFDQPITPMLSFNAKNDGKEREIDLGLILKETKFGVSATRLIFAECKSFNDEFKRDDIDKMKWITEKFPGSVAVFATLRKELTLREKRLIGPLANKGRKQWKTELPYNPILILTSTELLSNFGPPECWKDAGDFYRPFAEQYERSWRELIPLCDVTQQMYLGLKPWSEWLDERRERVRRRRSQAGI